MKSWSCTSCAFIPISLHPFPPLAKGGQGGWSRHDQSQGLPMLSPSQSFRIPLARREESFSISKAPASPPLPPLRKGGKGIARSRRHSIAHTKTASRNRPSSSVNTNFSPPQADHKPIKVVLVGEERGDLVGELGFTLQQQVAVESSTCLDCLEIRGNHFIEPLFAFRVVAQEDGPEYSP